MQNPSTLILGPIEPKLATPDKTKDVLYGPPDAASPHRHQLEAWNAATSNQPAGRLDLKKIGMSGHSFGAVTTEAVSGETLPVGGQKFTEPRIKAAVVFSPNAPRAGRTDR